MVSAIESDDVEAVHSLLMQEADALLNRFEKYHIVLNVCERGQFLVLENLLLLHEDRQWLADPRESAAFEFACAGGNLQVVRQLLHLTGDRGIGVHLCRNRAFHNACSGGHLDVVNELLGLTGRRAVDVGAQDAAAFTAACTAGHTHVAQRLLELTGDRAVASSANSEAAFRGACAGGHQEVVRLLLALQGERTVNVHALHDSGIVEACKNGHTGCVQKLLALTGARAVDSAEMGRHLLRVTCAAGREEVLQQLLMLGGNRAVNVNANDEEAFFIACSNRRMGVVRQLLALRGQRRVDVHAAKGRSFVASCAAGHNDALHLLLSLGGDRLMPQRSYGCRAAEAAARGGHADALRALLRLQPPRAMILSQKCFNDAVGFGRATAVTLLLKLPQRWESSELARAASLQGCMLPVLARDDCPRDIAEQCMVNALQQVESTCRALAPVGIVTAMADKSQGSRKWPAHFWLLQRLARAVADGGGFAAPAEVQLWRALGLRSRPAFHLGGCADDATDSISPPNTADTVLLALGWMLRLAAGRTTQGTELQLRLANAFEHQAGGSAGALSRILEATRDMLWHGWHVPPLPSMPVEGRGPHPKTAVECWGRGAMVLHRAALRAALRAARLQ